MIIYKIRDKNTGLFSSGTSHIRWRKNGKVWNKIGHLKNHLTMLRECKLIGCYKDAEIIAYDCIINEIENSRLNIKSI